MELYQRYTFGKLMEGMMAALKKVWTKGLALSAVAFLPSALAFILAFRSLFDALGPFMGLAYGARYGRPEPEQIFPLLGAVLGSYGLLLLSVCLLALTMGLVQVFMTRMTLNAVKETPESFGKVLNESLGLIPKLLGQGVVLGLILVGAVLVFYILVVGVALLAGMFVRNNPIAVVLLVFLGIVAWLGLMAFLIWFQTKTLFASQMLVFDRGTKALAGIGRSFSVVKGFFWSVFGRNFLFRLAVGFALSVVTGPVFFALALPGYLDLIQGLLHGGGDIGQLLMLHSGSFALGVGVATYLETLGMAPLYPVFLTFLVADLRFRKNEIPSAPETSVE